MQPHRAVAAIVIAAAAGIAALYAVHSGRQYLRAQAAEPPSPPAHAEQASAADVEDHQPQRDNERLVRQLRCAVVRSDAFAVQRILAVAPRAATLRCNGGTLLHLAASQGSVEVMQLLVEAAPSALTAVDCALRSALHIAAFNGHEQAVRWLLQAAPQLAVMRDAWAGLPCMQRLPQHKDWQLCARWRKASQHWL